MTKIDEEIKKDRGRKKGKEGVREIQRRLMSEREFES